MPTENILQTVQHALQDVIAPDVRELKVRVAAIDEKLDVRFKGIDEKIDVRFKAIDEKMDLQFKALMSAISESKSQGEVATLKAAADLHKEVAQLHERVAVLESRLENQQ